MTGSRSAYRCGGAAESIEYRNWSIVDDRSIGVGRFVGAGPVGVFQCVLEVVARGYCGGAGPKFLSVIVRTSDNNIDNY